MQDLFEIINYLLIGTTALATVVYIGYAIYLIVINTEEKVYTRQLGIWLLFLPLAVFFSGITFVHFVIEKYSFLEFLFIHSKDIAIGLWAGLFTSVSYFLLQRHYLLKLERKIQFQMEQLKHLQVKIEEEKKKLKEEKQNEENS